MRITNELLLVESLSLRQLLLHEAVFIYLGELMETRSNALEEIQ